MSLTSRYEIESIRNQVKSGHDCSGRYEISSKHINRSMPPILLMTYLKHRSQYLISQTQNHQIYLNPDYFKFRFLSTYIPFNPGPFQSSSLTFPTTVTVTRKNYNVCSQSSLIRCFTPKFLSMLPEAYLSGPLAPIPMNFRYIAPYAGVALNPVQGHSGPSMNPTGTLTTCSKLDILLIPGPDPTVEPTSELIEFLERKWDELEHLLCVFTCSLFLVRALLKHGRSGALICCSMAGR